jgi:hypothetical protein
LDKQGNRESVTRSHSTRVGTIDPQRLTRR